MRSGNVSTIRFKNLMALILVGFSFSANSLNTKEFHQEKYAEAYLALNEKVAYCSELKNRDIDISDEWLNNQTIMVQKVVLFELLKAAEKRCAQIEETIYIDAIFELAVIGEKDALNEYLELRRYDLPRKENKQILDSVDRKHLDRLLKLEQYQMPFNIFSAFDKG